MVIDFHVLSYRGHLKNQWSSIFHIEALYKAMVIDLSYQDPLRWNGHWFSYAFISRPSAKAMVIVSYRGPLQKQWSSIFHIKALCKSNGHRSFISRPSSMEWSLIFICFHIEDLYKSNGHRSFISRPSSMEWSLIFLMFALMWFLF